MMKYETLFYIFFIIIIIIIILLRLLFLNKKTDETTDFFNFKKNFFGYEKNGYVNKNGSNFNYKKFFKRFF